MVALPMLLFDAVNMAQSEDPVTIKKYANRRLYNTGTSTYVTLEDLATMVKAGSNFVVYDAKTGEDITRSVLAQIIFEQENKEGQSLLPIAFLRQLIRFYGDSMQMLVPRYLEVSLDTLVREQEKMRTQVAQAFGVGGFGPLEDQVRRNMEMFQRTFAMFAPPFGRREGQASEAEKSNPGNAGSPSPPRPADGSEIDDLKRQMEEMQKRLERLGSQEAASKEPGKE
jgi:polyhydroxyalkanoate synthesis repressor PhaR